jgi:hypothetical protein
MSTPETHPMMVRSVILQLAVFVAAVIVCAQAGAQTLPSGQEIQGIQPTEPVSGQPIRVLMRSPYSLAFDNTVESSVVVQDQIVRITRPLVHQIALLPPPPPYWHSSLDLPPLPSGDYEIQLYVYIFGYPEESAVLAHSFQFTVAPAPIEVIPANNVWALLLLVALILSVAWMVHKRLA